MPPKPQRQQVSPFDYLEPPDASNARQHTQRSNPLQYQIPTNPRQPQKQSLQPYPTDYQEASDSDEVPQPPEIGAVRYGKIEQPEGFDAPISYRGVGTKPSRRQTQPVEVVRRDASEGSSTEESDSEDDVPRRPATGSRREPRDERKKHHKHRKPRRADTEPVTERERAR